jgi:hypothetical protein
MHVPNHKYVYDIWQVTRCMLEKARCLYEDIWFVTAGDYADNSEREGRDIL